MQIYKPYPGKGVQYGIVFMVIILAIMGTAAYGIFKASNNIMTILPMVGLKIFIVGIFGYFIFVAKTLTYIIDDQFLIIKWGFSQKKIELKHIVNVEKRMGLTAFKIAGAGWPGLHIGAYSLGNANVNLYATKLMGDVILLKSRWETIGITPENPEEFLEDLRKLVPQLEGDVIDPKADEAAEEEMFKKNEKVVRLLTRINIAFLVATFAWIKYKINTLPGKIPMHVGINGIDRYGSPLELYVMPLISLVVFIIMYILTRHYHGNKTAIYMLLGTPIFTTLLMNLAVISILAL